MDKLRIEFLHNQISIAVDLLNSRQANKGEAIILALACEERRLRREASRAKWIRRNNVKSRNGNYKHQFRK